MIAPFGGTAIIGRLITFYLLSKYTRAMAALHKDIDLMRTTSADDDAAPDHQVYCSTFWTLQRHFCGRARVEQPGSSALNGERLLRALKFLVSQRGRMTMLTLLSLPFIVVIFFILFTDPAYVRARFGLCACCASC